MVASSYSKDHDLADDACNRKDVHPAGTFKFYYQRGEILIIT